MGLLDTPLRAAAKSVLNTLGTSATLRQHTPGAVDVEQGIQVAVDTDTTVKGALESYRNFEVSDVVLATDRKFTMAASLITFVPEVGDRLVIGTTVYRIRDVKTVQAQDDPALLVLQIRA